MPPDPGQPLGQACGILTSIDNSKLPRAQHLIWEDLVDSGDVLEGGDSRVMGAIGDERGSGRQEVRREPTGPTLFSTERWSRPGWPEAWELSYNGGGRPRKLSGTSPWLWLLNYMVEEEVS